MSIGNYLTPDEAARKLKVSVGRIYQFASGNRIQAIRVGRQLFIDHDSVDNFKKIERPNGRPIGAKTRRKNGFSSPKKKSGK
jgi:excisionase family DNA binding protein